MSRLHLVFLASSALFAGCAGEDGQSYLTDLTDEPAGANCASGGIKVSTGPDSNDNGELDDSEVVKSDYLCTAAVLQDVATEAPGANCPKGGAKITAGTDSNKNGMLDAAEVTSTNYVCGSGEARVAKSFAAAGVNITGTAEIDVITAQITAPSSGTLLAIATSDAFCTAAECPAGNPAVSGAYYITNDANQTASPAEYDLFFLTPGVTTPMTRTATYPVAQAGVLNFKSRADRTAGGTYQLYRNALTLVFLP